MNNKIDNGQIYELVDRMRLEVKGDINRLETKFDGLESGRITKMEGEVTQLRVSIATAATKLAILGFISASVVGAIVSVIVAKVLS